MIRPPSHRIDAQPIVISEHDTAWDRERIKAELDALGDDAARHPFVQYHNAQTRYDLGVVITLPDGTQKAVTEYLDLAQAWQFHGRRLGHEAFYRLQPMLRSNEALAYTAALRECLQRIEGPGAPQIKHDGLGSVTAESVQALFDISPSLPTEIGQALLLASMPLGPAEKKP
jgi:hypothetical protein